MTAWDIALHNLRIELRESLRRDVEERNWCWVVFFGTTLWLFYLILADRLGAEIPGVVLSGGVVFYVLMAGFCLGCFWAELKARRLD